MPRKNKHAKYNHLLQEKQLMKTKQWEEIFEKDRIKKEGKDFK